MMTSHKLTHFYCLRDIFLHSTYGLAHWLEPRRWRKRISNLVNKSLDASLLRPLTVPMPSCCSWHWSNATEPRTLRWSSSTTARMPSSTPSRGNRKAFSLNVSQPSFWFIRCWGFYNGDYNKWLTIIGHFRTMFTRHALDKTESILKDLESYQSWGTPDSSTRETSVTLYSFHFKKVHILQQDVTHYAVLRTFCQKCPCVFLSQHYHPYR